MEILTDWDKALVIYVWPPKLNLNRLVQPYSKKHLDESYTKASKTASKAELLRYMNSAYIAEGQKGYLKLYCGHTDGHSVLISDTIRQTFQDNQMNIYPETLQAAFAMVCGWLIGADTQSFNCDHFTELLRSLPKFVRPPGSLQKTGLKMEKGESIHPGEGTQGIVILCNTDYLTETNIAMKATFNRSTPQAIAESPDGLNFKYIEYFAEAKSKTATHKQLTDTKKQSTNNKILTIGTNIPKQ
jgi:hypothetical protein